MVVRVPRAVVAVLSALLVLATSCGGVPTDSPETIAALKSEPIFELRLGGDPPTWVSVRAGIENGPWSSNTRAQAVWEPFEEAQLLDALGIVAGEGVEFLLAFCSDDHVTLKGNRRGPERATRATARYSDGRFSLSLIPGPLIQDDENRYGRDGATCDPTIAELLE